MRDSRERHKRPERERGCLSLAQIKDSQRQGGGAVFSFADENKNQQG